MYQQATIIAREEAQYRTTRRESTAIALRLKPKSKWIFKTILLFLFIYLFTVIVCNHTWMTDRVTEMYKITNISYHCLHCMFLNTYAVTLLSKSHTHTHSCV